MCVLIRGNHARDVALADLIAPSTSRHTLVCLRVAWLPTRHKPNRSARLRPRLKPRFALSSAFGEALRRSSLAPAPRLALVRAIHRRSASPGFVARVYALLRRYAPCHACASARLSRTAALRVAKLAHRAFNPRLARLTLSMYLRSFAWLTRLLRSSCESPRHSSSLSLQLLHCLLSVDVIVELLS